MFNADDYKNVNREQWQATAQAWPGDHVLDLAAGNGPASSPRARVGLVGSDQAITLKSKWIHSKSKCFPGLKWHF